MIQKVSKVNDLVNAKGESSNSKIDNDDQKVLKLTIQKCSKRNIVTAVDNDDPEGVKKPMI